MKTPLPKQHARCALCPRNKQAWVAPCGEPRTAAFVWLDEEPRQHQVKHDFALSGASMQRLEELHAAALADARRSWDARELYVTFAALCQAINPRDDKERRTAIACCRPRLLAELRKLAPSSMLLALDKWAVFALTGSEKKIEGKYGFHVPLYLKELRKLAEVAIADIARKASAK